LKRLLLVSLVVLTGCGIGGRTPSPASPTATTSAGSTPMMPAFLSVSGPTGGPLLAVVRRDRTTTITSRLGGTKVKITGTDVRYTRHGRLLTVVRPETGGAWLLSASGRTLWRARTVHDVVQVRQGAKLRYEFRRQGDDRILVRRGTTDIGAVRATEQGALLVDAQGTTIGTSSSPPAVALAVLVCDEIPPDLRAILTAALLPR
jgi:hypothetical protein